MTVVLLIQKFKVSFINLHSAAEKKLKSLSIFLICRWEVQSSARFPQRE